MTFGTDVYDLASWCAVSELSERFVRSRLQAVDIPDFTRGVWKAPCDSNLADASLDISKLDFKDIEKAEGQMNV